MKKTFTAVLVMLFMTIAFAGCQSTNNFIGKWETSMSDTRDMQGYSIEYTTIVTLEFKDDNTYQLVGSLEDEDALIDNFIEVFDQVKADTMESAELTEDEFEDYIKENQGMTWDEFIDATIEVAKEELKSGFEAATINGEWQIDGDELSIYEKIGDTAQDTFKIEDGKLVSNQGMSFDKAD